MRNLVSIINLWYLTYMHILLFIHLWDALLSPFISSVGSQRSFSLFIVNCIWFSGGSGGITSCVGNYLVFTRQWIVHYRKTRMNRTLRVLFKKKNSVLLHVVIQYSMTLIWYYLPSFMFDIDFALTNIKRKRSEEVAFYAEWVLTFRCD